MLKNQLFTILSVCWVTLIFVVCLKTPPDDVALPKIPHLDKIVHFGLYFILTLLLFLTFRKEIFSVKKLRNIYFFSFFISVFIGILIEILQETQTTSRSGDFFDVVANIFGTLVALSFSEFINRKFSKLVLKKN